ncbi:hypothetical protein O181_083166 [Austropuccinia psidii MF-1]|uniref:hydroxymethylglutaryl-CoA lyase n=1 Tax=Austropuccinia psidii MF-1 TaxID=1389203 RepID=A0A9Q3FNJ4_9BASI|nr:hypothetical protein [Austropuccinia psidii MF-1]
MMKLITHRTSACWLPRNHVNFARAMSVRPKIESNRITRRPVRIMEVSPRDGLQNEPEVLPVDVKVYLIEKLSQLNFEAIEIGSFVSPKWVPQMASTSEILLDPILKQARKSSDVTFSCLIPNLKGFEAFNMANYNSNATEPIAKEIALFASATEGFSKANLNSSIADSLRKMADVAHQAKNRNIKIRGYISCAFGCPFEGKVNPKQVASVTKALLEMGCYEVAISDTIGVGVPGQVEDCLNRIAQNGIRLEELGIHCHDTFGTGLLNVLKAVEMGIQTVDSSVGGIGGCPYSPGATGNISTEDVVYALESSGYSTGLIDLGHDFEIGTLGTNDSLLRQLEPLSDVGDWINRRLNRVNSSRVGRAILARKQRKPWSTSSS